MKKELLITILLCLTILAFGAYGCFRIAVSGLSMPRVYIGDVNVGMMTESEIIGLLSHYKTSSPIVTFIVDDSKSVSELIEASWDASTSARQAMLYGRKGNLWNQLREQLNLLRSTEEVTPSVVYDPEVLEERILRVKDELNTEGQKAYFEIVGDEIIFHQGTDGVIVDEADLKEKIHASFMHHGEKKILPKMIGVNMKIDEDRVTKNRETITRAVSTSRKILADPGFEMTLDKNQIAKLVGTSDNLDTDELRALYDVIAPKITMEPRNASFSFENDRVVELTPERMGQSLEIDKFAQSIRRLIYEGVESDRLVLLTVEPEIRLEDINNLGIKEMIGQGKSTFRGSIPSRIFNIDLSSKRISGVIVPAGEVFSFNKTVGEISKATGYQSAYIISGGRTVLGDGGGVCQVSTTVFRAALSAGLSIVERRPHAYRVSYYEQDSAPGLDASIFYPTADLKFRNDTDNNILIQTEVDAKDLSMKVSIFGVDDGREVSISKSRITKQSSPPEDLYVDDPTMKKGQKKQIDFRAYGANVAFDYVVKRNGDTLSDRTFYSNYQPWRAIFLIGTAD
jgi:vancomycin resistance protein YoaR